MNTVKLSAHPAVWMLCIIICFLSCEESHDEVLKAQKPEEEDGSTDNSTPCDACDHIVDSHLTDGDELDIQPGDIICLSATSTYNRLLFRNIKGTRKNPIVIRNCDGVAKIFSEDAFGLKFERSEYFILAGDGSAEKYGIKVTTTSGFYVSFEQFTTDFEVYQLEIAGKNSKTVHTKDGGFSGIGIKTSPYQDCELFTDPTRQAWVMRNVTVHDNYIHDTGGEGLYIGHGFYKGRKEANCSGTTYSHSIKGLRIYNNLIENVGYDGIQIKNADEDVEVYNNVVRNYGVRDHNAHNEGLLIGEGTVGKFYNNLIMTGSGHACQLQGMGDVYIYNNVFANSGQSGIYAAHGDMVVRYPDGAFNIFNNTIYNSAEYGYIFYNEDGGPKRFINNLVVNSGKPDEKDASTEKTNNLFTNDVALASFLNADLQDFSLAISSKAIDAGTDLSVYGIEEDLQGVPRPQGKAFDLGAFEYAE